MEMRISELSYDVFVSLTFLCRLSIRFVEDVGKRACMKPNWLTFICLTDYFHFFMPFQSCIDHLEAFVRYSALLSLLLRGKGKDES